MNNGISNNRVVATGIGCLSPLGLDIATTWQNLIAGKSGIDYITLFDAAKHKTRFAGEVKGFDPTAHIGRKEARRMDRFSQLSVSAAIQAVAQSKLEINSGNRDKIGVIVGSGIGGLTTLFEETKVLLESGPSKVSPFLVPMMISDMAAAQISITLGIKGVNLGVSSACSSSSDAIGVAYELIRRGDAEAAITGGSEAIINPIGIASFNALNALSTRNDAPQQASRPFDADRDGFVIGEGACILILESLEHAQKRGATILAEIAAYGASGDAFHITQPDEGGDGAIRAMRMALDKACLTPKDIDYINAHGTSTPMNDRIETMAIKAVFADQAHHVAISSTKSMTGHLIGAAGALEASVCVMAIQNGVIPPTINLNKPAPECDLDYVPNVARKTTVNTALSNTFGFGGHNSVLIIKRYSES
ncbi:MAG: beta-ketoacyl-[acyl-carrier-protein] synthase II [Chloroflexi bacterium RBG_16_51_9]|nr:MAG: beta-ketoacyl-[acyl-carrier-protein] synthase II [Chloroflexi bacterium RBG_16_51_9]